MFLGPDLFRRIAGGCRGALDYTALFMNTASSGISIGSVIAVAISWSINKSIMWAIVHGFFSWFYVIYYTCF